jgi:hypothetical protein
VRTRAASLGGEERREVAIGKVTRRLGARVWRNPDHGHEQAQLGVNLRRNLPTVIGGHPRVVLVPLQRAEQAALVA